MKIKNPFRRKKSYPETGGITILIIDDQAETIHGTLGITDKRYDELVTKLFNFYKEGDDLTSTFVEIGKQCTHPNEFATMCYVLFDINQKANSPRIPDFITRIIKGRDLGDID